MARLIEAYFDESEPKIGRRVFAIAGYLMWPDQARAMEAEWGDALDRFGIKCFHMADCAADPGNGEFKRSSKDQRIELVKQLIKIIKNRTQRGICILTNPSSYEKHEDRQGKLGLINHYNGPISTLLIWIGTALRESGDPSSIQYYFESGHNLQSTANRVINSLVAEDKGADIRYAGHAFLPKDASPLLQAGDLLAWQSAKDLKNQLTGRPRRKDFMSLLEHRHTMMTAIPGPNNNDYFTHYETPPASSQLRQEVVTDFFRSGGTKLDLPHAGPILRLVDWKNLPQD